MIKGPLENFIRHAYFEEIMIFLLVVRIDLLARGIIMI